VTTIVLFKRNTTSKNNYLKICYDTKFQDLVLSCTGVAHTLKVCMGSLLIYYWW